MNRRGFLKAIGALSAGLALRTVPVLGETFSVLEAPRVYAGVAVEPDTLAHYLEHLPEGVGQLGAELSETDYLNAWSALERADSERRTWAEAFGCERFEKGYDWRTCTWLYSGSRGDKYVAFTTENELTVEDAAALYKPRLDYAFKRVGR